MASVAVDEVELVDVEQVDGAVVVVDGLDGCCSVVMPDECEEQSSNVGSLADVSLGWGKCCPGPVAMFKSQLACVLSLPGCEVGLL